jgi:hypothetical protein
MSTRAHLGERRTTTERSDDTAAEQSSDGTTPRIRVR